MSTGVLHRVLRSRLASAQLAREVCFVTRQNSHRGVVSAKRTPGDHDNFARRHLRRALRPAGTFPRAPTATRFPVRTPQSGLYRG